jgi:hypothetical protein
MATKKTEDQEQKSGDDASPQELQQQAAKGQSVPEQRPSPVTPAHNPPDPQNLGEGRPAPIMPESEQQEAAPEGAEPATTQNPDGMRPQDHGLAGTGPYDPLAPRQPAEAPEPVRNEGAAEAEKKSMKANEAPGDDGGSQKADSKKK